MQVAAPPIVATLKIQFIGATYPVPVSRGTTIEAVKTALRELVPSALRASAWDMIGLAAKDGGSAWTPEKWELMKVHWMQSSGRDAVDVWLVMKQ